MPAFPIPAQHAFNTAAHIWARMLNSSVPITIRACWGALGEDSYTFGYSGGGAYIRDFAGATHGNTWFASSLANALSGRDLVTSEDDMHITINNDLPGVYHWNYRTDGIVEPDKYDLLTVALHEICHGLGFAGSMTGSSIWGIEGFPFIYDVFTKDVFGTRLIDYDDSSQYSLGQILTSGVVFFHGANAMAANQGKRVELFTPDVWMPGSSYSHLNMNFNLTSDRLMVYMLGRGYAIHSPGPVTLGLLKDLGWPNSIVDPPGPPYQPQNEKNLTNLLLLLGS